MPIRELTEDDAEPLRELRLRALSDDPDAFLVTYEEDRQSSVDDFSQRLSRRHDDVASDILGAFDDDGHLVGMVGYYRVARAKVRHRATIWGLFVVPAARSNGVGRALMLSAIERLRKVEAVEQIQLTVVTKNTNARSLYRTLGFEAYGLDVHAMKHHGRYFDEELLVLHIGGPGHRRREDDSD